MLLVLLLIGTRAATSATRTRCGDTSLRLAYWLAHEKKRRWITNSAGVYLLELAPVAVQTLPSVGPTATIAGLLVHGVGLRRVSRGAFAGASDGCSRPHAGPAAGAWGGRSVILGGA